MIKSEICNYQGDLNCGICKCNDGFYGKHCICSGNETQSNIKDDCRASANDNSDCSNHGTCQCGRCECEIRENPAENFSGKYCECNNFSCLRDNDQVCKIISLKMMRIYKVVYTSTLFLDAYIPRSPSLRIHRCILVP